MKPTLFAIVTIVFLWCSTERSLAQSAPRPLPNPVLYFLNQQYVTSNGTSTIRYMYGVLNSDAYPDALFAASPALPPCGANTNAARTWVDLFDQRGKRLNGFCALGKSDNLNKIWFALPEGEVPPSWIYIEMTDRQAGTKYKSNLAETTN